MVTFSSTLKNQRTCYSYSLNLTAVLLLLPLNKDSSDLLLPLFTTVPSAGLLKIFFGAVLQFTDISS